MAEELRAEGRDQVAFVGTAQGLEARLVPQAGVEFIPLPSRGFDRARPLTLVVAAFQAVASVFRGLGIIRRYRPDVVVGFGGYVSLPLGLAAVLARVPLVLHEQNSVPGLANKVLARWATRIGVTYPDTAGRVDPERVEMTGNPVRAQVLASTRDAGREMLGVPSDAVVLLVFGGSRGARHLNEATVTLYSRLMEVERLYVIHVAGQKEAQSVREALRAEAGEAPARYAVYEYIDRMGDALAAADLIVARAGATSIAEITALGKPAILVPYPYATDDHQTGNARSVVEAGAGAVVPDSELDSPRYADVVVRLLSDPAERAKMAGASAALGRPGAAEAVAEMARAAGRR